MRFQILLLAFALLCISTKAPSKETAPPLTVVVVIDQFPMEYLDRFGDLFGEGGFKRLEREGVVFTECRFSHAVLETGPGHTTIATGTNAHDHGIVGNAWFDASGDEEYCVACDSTYIVSDSGITTEKASCPNKILVDGLSDYWLNQFGEDARVWSLSLKDRAAIAMGGKRPDGALWYSRKLGQFVSSSYYFDKLPEWAVSANSTLSLYMDSTWTRIAPDSAYFRVDTDRAWYEDGQAAGLPNTFPKQMGDGTRDAYFRAVQATPFGNMLLLMMAGECLASESLGQDDVPDLLWVSFSSNDICGHLYGPLSQEVLDMTVRTDATIEKLLNFLDGYVGNGKYRLALTADHGVCAPAESPLVPEGVGGRIDLEKMRKSLDKHLTHEFRNGRELKGGFVAGLDVPTVYLNEKVIDSSGVSVRAVAEESAEYLQAQEGIANAVVTLSKEDVAAISDLNLRSHIERSYFEERFPQVYLHPQPYWQSDGICANHGSIHNYDTHVPLIFFGPGFSGGRNETPCDPCDLAVTLAASTGKKWVGKRDGASLLTRMK